MADVYNPEDIGLCGSPQLVALEVNLAPSPSPPPQSPPQANPDSSPGRPGRKDSIHGDAVLFGSRPGIAEQAAPSNLLSDGHEEEEPRKGSETTVLKDDADSLTTLATKAMVQSVLQLAKNSELMEARKQVSPDITIKTEIKASEGDLPPILSRSLQSNPKVTLPSISDQLGDINHLIEPGAAANFPLAQSLPEQSGLPPLCAIPRQADRQLPYPIQDPNSSSIQQSSKTDEGQYSNADTLSTKTAMPTTDESTPVVPIYQTSINNTAIPQTSGFQCTYPGCTAQPFQTQYLLNSHANVHSLNRPHYCSVKGCPRSEGGKGFKRKNELIRHGLVHESPGYVCPFCPNKEQKSYPRPDNLQRHVRVHHVDKDKDDAQLREVLSQRSEQTRGRRRRK